MAGGGTSWHGVVLFDGMNKENPQVFEQFLYDVQVYCAHPKLGMGSGANDIFDLAKEERSLNDEASSNVYSMGCCPAMPRKRQRRWYHLEKEGNCWFI